MDILNSLFLLAVFWVFLDISNSMYIALQSNIKLENTTIIFLFKLEMIIFTHTITTPHTLTILIDLYEDDKEQQKTMYTYK